jgi:hypothetical protein
MKKISRRKFVKNTAILSAGITAFPMILVPKARTAWAMGTVVHPNVDNLRVVGITDSKMTRIGKEFYSWSRQDDLVVGEVVWENIDKLACGLVQTKNPEEAWRTIFVKPPRKSWSDTVVAIKTNNIAKQHTRSAVMAKICHTLTDLFGVMPTNIHIYDATHGGAMSRHTPFAGLPEGVKIEDTWGGIDALTSVPEPWRGGEEKSRCLRHLVARSVDILINIAMCKGHSSRFGGFTMTMKNHLGTFSPGPAHEEGSQDYLMAINKTTEILGTMEKRTGKVLYPRQQLCLIDGLWASKKGPGVAPSHQPNFLAMGVLSPVVDYQVATKFRGEKMGWKPNMKATRRMLKEFGYKEGDLPEGGKLIEV